MVPKALSRPTKTVIGLGLLLPVVLIGIPALLAHRAEAKVKTSFSWVTHTLQVQDVVQSLLNSLIDAETGQRGFLLTHRALYLEPYDAGKVRVAQQLQDVTVLTADNASQQQRLREVRPLIDERMTILAETIADEERGEHDAALALVNSDRGKNTMDKIRGVLRQMRDEESRLLMIRQQRFSSETGHSATILLALVAASACCALVIFYLLHRLSGLQPLVRMCAWSRTIEYQGQWISFEEYLQRRFDISTSHGIAPSELEKMRALTEP